MFVFHMFQIYGGALVQRMFLLGPASSPGQSCRIDVSVCLDPLDSLDLYVPFEYLGPLGTFFLP